MERRLAVILAADVVAYSRLMEADEEGTLAKLRSHRDELINPTIAEHHGRVVKLVGDGVLVEFGSAADAYVVRSVCKREWQVVWPQFLSISAPCSASA
jgi:adenylate cyclase